MWHAFVSKFGRDQPAGQFVRFGLIGALGAGLNFAIYAGGLFLGLHYIAASFVGWFCALIPVFALNRRHTFRSSGSPAGDFGRTLLVYIVQQGVVAAALYLAVGVGKIPPLAGYFVALPLAIATSFLGMKYFAMKSQSRP